MTRHTPRDQWRHAGAADDLAPQTRVTVMGLGSFGGGIGLTRYLVHQGAHVTVTDLQGAEALTASLEALRGLPIRFVLGGHQERDFCETDVVFVNPAVPLTSPYLQLARAHHVPLDSEMNLFVRQCQGRIIGLTGSVGKTTTTSLLGSILQLHDPRTLVGGNIGGSLLERLPDDYARHAGGTRTLQLSIRTARLAALQSAVGSRAEPGAQSPGSPWHYGSLSAGERGDPGLSDSG